MTIFNDLARELKGSTKKALGNALSSLKFELGTITCSGVKLDNFKYEIGDYQVLDYLKMNDEYTTELADSHIHTFKTPDNLRPLKDGDRVLVIPVGNEIIVIGRIT
ncbi:hypothetical protein [Clostridium botulinum]|uniref:hypothetical protein n=1 Tax=Clostridium botulinum TaxID=1491 RepID=UPI0004D76FDE|nr:hypothetical protein [Clostridium botulinum]KEH96185.1 hypothetical protein Z953_p0253 [Clostridium botulinum D str. 16868]MCD3202812.1 hypothetical protein [Clostridium botulinum C/D]MCD3230900.1 hypothetical protein [Clostridium botulinum C/D]MCD3253914.1 hypothetical protein [Clostridium botulinum C/D]MCD3279490.1 hypothetical protein [Clostridium botulinum C/D]